MYAIIAWQKKTQFFTLWAIVNTPSPFEMCLKEENFNCVRFSINPTLILFGHDGKTTLDKGYDFILLNANFFVYKCRLSKLRPTLEAFINNLWHIYEVDKHVHLMEMTYEKFVKKWTPHNHLVTWMCLTTFVCTSVNLTHLCSAQNYVCAYTHKCLSPVFQCSDDKIWLVTQHCLNKKYVQKKQKKRWLRTNIPWQFVCELTSLISFPTMLRQHNQPTLTSLCQDMSLACNLSPALLAKWLWFFFFFFFGFVFVFVYLPLWWHRGGPDTE